MVRVLILQNKFKQKTILKEKAIKQRKPLNLLPRPFLVHKAVIFFIVL